jgi:uncharacterized protein YbaR (Trm112 family)
MHILLTDVLCCPRCGPDHGLIMLADRLEERRIREGRLGCANCRGSYPVRGGAADLRTQGEAPPGTPAGGVPAPAAVEAGSRSDPDAAVRLAALLDLAGGATMALLAGAHAAHGAALAALLPDVEVIALDPPAPHPEGVSVLLCGGDRLPLRSLSLRAVALGTDAAVGPAEGLRVLAVGGRLVIEEPDPESLTLLEGCGARILLHEQGIAVASRERHL